MLNKEALAVLELPNKLQVGSSLKLNKDGFDPNNQKSLALLPELNSSDGLS